MAGTCVNTVLMLVYGAHGSGQALHKVVAAEAAKRLIGSAHQRITRRTPWIGQSTHDNHTWR